MENRTLAHLVADKLQWQWSPEQIAGWLKRTYPDETSYQVDVILFQRTTRRVKLSDQGERAYAWARKILEDVQDMSNEMSNIKSDPSEPLRISSSLRLGRNHVAPILSQLGQQFPKLDIWLELINSRLDLIAESIDIEIRVGEITEPHLITHRIIKSYRVLCAAPSYPGYGIMMLSDWDVSAELANGSLVRVLLLHSQSADVWAATSARLAGTANERLTIEFLIEHLREGPFALQV